MSSSVVPVEDDSQRSTDCPEHAQLTSETINVVPPDQGSEDSLPTGTEDGALESHEIIGLQTFIERKTWIEEKIKFLEKMPPVEVFNGLDAVKLSEEVPGLPTREELQQWIIEHDAIEKETEIFDTGELQKLRIFTRAATQKNLSPEDTDLIELTLTTIYELDKLLHLLRDRSDNLDLLGIRLTWEEHRVASWKERKQIISDLETFLNSRARWSSNVYDDIRPESLSPAPSPRGSNDEGPSDSQLLEPKYSRTGRFQLTESLIRDAAQFAVRVNTLGRTGVNAAGKALDKLIDTSRKPVPDELLDEQDKLEEQGLNEIENLGSFAMGVAMQWRKSDEIYVETLKDQAAAQALIDELETALSSHPVTNKSTSFLSRSDSLSKRLTLRGHPVTFSGTLPRPSHSLFPQQEAFNQTLVHELQSAISAASSVVRKAQTLAKDYCSRCEAVERVEKFTTVLRDVSEVFSSVIQRLETGITSVSGDGAPPVLDSKECLDPNRHSTFVALFPGLLTEQQQAEEKSQEILRQLPSALQNLDFSGLSDQFRENAVATMQETKALQEKARALCNASASRISALRVVRQIWSSMENGLKELDSIRRCIADDIEGARWHQEAPFVASPPTPESPVPLLLPPDPHNSAYLERIQRVQALLEENVSNPLNILLPQLEEPLRTSLQRSVIRMSALSQRIVSMNKILRAITFQSSRMREMHNEAGGFQLLIESVGQHFDDAIASISSGTVDAGNLVEDLCTKSTDVYTQIAAFTNNTIHRVPFVAAQERSLLSKTSVRRTLPTLDLNDDLPDEDSPLELPVDPQEVDGAVRADCNAVAMRLSGDLRGLEQKLTHLKASQVAVAFDGVFRQIVKAVDDASAELATIRASIPEISIQHSVAITELEEMQRNLEDHIQCHDTVALRLPDLQEELKNMEAIIGKGNGTNVEVLLTTRRDMTKGVTDRIDTWKREGLDLLEEVTALQDSHRRKLEEVEAAQAEKMRLEQQRQAEEDALLDESALTAEIRQSDDEAVPVPVTGRSQAEDSPDARVAELPLSLAAKLDADYNSASENGEDEQDVFGEPGHRNGGLLTKIARLHRRLSSLNISSFTHRNSDVLPNGDDYNRLLSIVSEISVNATTLAANHEDISTTSQMSDLLSDIAGAQKDLELVQKLADLEEIIQTCDAALSDLLEHIDSYPSYPTSTLSSFSHRLTTSGAPEVQMRSRLDSTDAQIQCLTDSIRSCATTLRVTLEHDRILQTWKELEEMALDRISGQASRPSSSVSSTHTSVSSTPVTKQRQHNKLASYSSLSVHTPQHSLAPSPLKPTLRAVSTARSTEASSSKASFSRSASGPVSSTFSSRQRTTSLTSAATRRPSHVAQVTPIFTRSKRSASPFSTSSFANHHSSSSVSSWSRASTNRLSFPTVPRRVTPSATPAKKPVHKPRKTYVANPKSKLDVAVGKVVNNLPVGINVESVSGNWKDQSGKYWIGDQDPKLCFCRILRSQTVMVRVGGGWTELSKFIRDHFADSFRLLAASPIQSTVRREEKWISSATLLAPLQGGDTPDRPRTPDAAKTSFLPSFALSTPNGKSPHSIHSTPSSQGSPLTALQFMRRADRDAPLPPHARPETPSKPPQRHKISSNVNTPARTSIWRY